MVKCLFKSNVSRVILLTNCVGRAYIGTNRQKQKLHELNLPGYVLYFLTALNFHISIQIFCNLIICLVLDGLLQLICFRMFCSKHLITFDTYLRSCWFHCVDILCCIKFRACETFRVTNSGARVSLIETMSNFRTIMCWFILYLHMYMCRYIHAF